VPIRGPVAATPDCGSGIDAGATTHTLTLTTAPPLGSLLVLNVVWAPVVSNVTSFADNAGTPNAWNWAAINALTTHPGSAVAYAWMDDASLTHITFVQTGSAQLSWEASFYTASAGGNIGRTPTTTGTSNTTATTSLTTTITPTSQYNLIVQAVGNTSTAAITPSGSFIEMSDQAGATFRGESAYLIVNGKSAVTFGGSGTSSKWVLAAASFPCDNPFVQAVPVRSSLIVPSLAASR
jgi:hypothetical protein